MAKTLQTSLAATAARQVQRRIRNRGAEYFRRQKVEIEYGDSKTMSATVYGSERYDVQLAYAPDSQAVVASCTCPYFHDHADICKHIWATLLTCDSYRLLENARQADWFTLLPDAEAVGEVGDLLDQDDLNEIAGTLPPGSTDRSRRTHSGRRHQRRQQRQKEDPKKLWNAQISALRQIMTPQPTYESHTWPANRQLLYVIEADESRASGGLTVSVMYQQLKRDGKWGVPKTQRIYEQVIEALPDPADRQVCALLSGPNNAAYGWYGSYYHRSGSQYVLTGDLYRTMLPMMCATGRCVLRPVGKQDKLTPLQWDGGEPWQLWLKVEPVKKPAGYLIGGSLRRGDEQMALTDPLLIVSSGLIFTEGQVAPMQSGAFAWLGLFSQQNPIHAPLDQGDELLETILSLPHLPRLELPESLAFERVTETPRPYLHIRMAEDGATADQLVGEYAFEYAGIIVGAGDERAHLFDRDSRRLIERDVAAEHAAELHLRQLGFKALAQYRRENDQQLGLAPSRLSKVVAQLLKDDWHVEAEGKLYRTAGSFDIEVQSGIDWFELHGELAFGETSAKLPDLLKAIQRGETTVQLDDGTFGVLPEQWLNKYGMLAGLGEADGDHMRFSPTQVGLLDALLATMPEARWDEQSLAARDRLRTFEGVEPRRPPGQFEGQLREYQCDGLGWLYFLQDFGFGGCLADDMGLGKTVQVLAMLESQRIEQGETGGQAQSNGRRPTLVVAPKSVVFNWKAEAARFTPKLRVLDHTGLDRCKDGANFDEHDLIITTYGTLRRDAAMLKDRPFSYVILDEAQAIKNPKTASAKAARLLQARHRLALTGTPIENHLGDLWSLFEFLNPGMLGTASIFDKVSRASAGAGEDGLRPVLGRVLRPFLLRRTKQQVAKDLPEKLEQTQYCDLPAKQRKQYDELREYYRRSLLPKIDDKGMNKSKIQILEALLRLRQAACHPGLIDESKAAQPCAKLDALLPQLAEVVDEGHKALVFSQFTSMLAIVRKRLDAEKITYEYLDGRTRKRGQKIERFQNDPDCKLFLISLKAGGLGLNLTAAEYVFLLDPWWNPAVEAQAIDRAHRIGQTRRVFAYRLIARDTVEEKVLELQQSKRELADAIISQDNSLIRTLKREDLELLLS